MKKYKKIAWVCDADHVGSCELKTDFGQYVALMGGSITRSRCPRCREERQRVADEQHRRTCS